MNKILYLIDKDCEKHYSYQITEDTIIYHFSINSSVTLDIQLCKPGITLYYYYSNINYEDHFFQIHIHHLAERSNSYVFAHGVNVFNHKLDYLVSLSVPKSSSQCICNQDNQIINLGSGKSTICPNLFIDNYDVDSAHAAYIGKFKDEILFYLMSRGISPKVSYRLLLEGFLIYMDSIDQSKIKLFLEEIKKI